MQLYKNQKKLFKQTPPKKRSSFTDTIQSKKAFPALMCRMSLQQESQTFQSCFLGTIFFFLNPGIILSITIKHNRIFFSCQCFVLADLFMVSIFKGASLQNKKGVHVTSFHPKHSKLNTQLCLFLHLLRKCYQ